MQIPLLSKESKGAEIQYFLLFAIFLLFIFGDHVRDAFIFDDKTLTNRQSSPQGRVEIPLSTGLEVLQRYPEIYRLCQENAETLFRADPSRGLDIPVEVTFLEALAVGKYGAIVKASGNGEIFALKILKLQPDDMEKGDREVMIQHYLSTHQVEEVPKIKFGVKVHKLDLYERRYKGFAMELFAHPTLLDYLATTVQYLSVPDRLQLIRGQGFLRNTYIIILGAIQKMWARGVVHGDLHARNILWDAQNNQTRIIDFGEARLPFKNQQKKYQLGIVEDLARYTMGFVSSILFPRFALERRLNEIPQDEIYQIQQVSEELCPAMREIRDGYFPRVESFQTVLEFWREQQDIHPMAKVAPSREKVRDSGLLILDKPDWNTADSPETSIEESIGKFDENFQDDRGIEIHGFIKSMKIPFPVDGQS